MKSKKQYVGIFILITLLVILNYQNCAPLQSGSTSGSTSSSSTNGGGTGDPTNTTPPPTLNCTNNLPPQLITTSLANMTARSGMESQAGSSFPGSITIVATPGTGESQSLTLRIGMGHHKPDGTKATANLVDVNVNDFTTVDGVFRASFRFREIPEVECVNGYADVTISVRDQCNANSTNNIKFRLDLTNACLDETRLRASDPGNYENFGYKVHMDNNFLAVLASKDTQNGTKAGAVYVYRNTGTSWAFDQKVMPNDTLLGENNANLQLAEIQSVFIRGTRLFVGVPYRGQASAVYVFERNSTSNQWEQKARLLDPNSSDTNLFGLAIAATDTTLMVGAPNEAISGLAQAGAVYVYTRSGSVWTQTRKLTATTSAARQMFGFSLDVDGSSAVIGAPVDTNFYASNSHGSGSVFFLNDVLSSAPLKITSAQTPSLTISNSRGIQFGYSVAINAGRIAIGAPAQVNNSGAIVGAAYVLTPNTSNPGQYDILRFIGSEVDKRYGANLDLNGKRFVVGVPFGSPDNVSKAGQGFYYDLTRTNPTTPAFKLMARLNNRIINYEFGNSVSLNGNGEVAIGSWLADGAQEIDSGIAYILQLLP